MEISTKPRREHRRRRRGLLALLMASTAIISATGATMSLALFTSSAAAANNQFTTGTIVIGINPAATILTAGVMMPGDSVPAGVPGQVVTVSNTGTGTFRYSVTGIATLAPLASQLTITIRQPDGNVGVSCALFNGTVLNTITTVGTTTTNLVGDPAQGNQGGDRTLVGGASEVLCFKASLPIGTLNTYQGTTTTMTFTFSAEQTANNP
jgi:hypothetical protein